MRRADNRVRSCLRDGSTPLSFDQAGDNCSNTIEYFARRFLDEACLPSTPIDASDVIRKHDAGAFFHVDRNF